MITLASLHHHQRSLRDVLIQIVEPVADRVDEIPEGWRNNLRWHAGHLLVTPWVLAVGRMGHPMPYPPDYERWFRHGTSPADWEPGDVLPSWKELKQRLPESLDELYQRLEHCDTSTPYPAPLTTSANATLYTLGEGLVFSSMHDGIHLGQARGLVRALR